MWSLYAELHLRHRQFTDEQQQQPQQQAGSNAEGAPGGAEAAGSGSAQPAPMDEALGETPATDGAQDGQSRGAQPADLRQLFREHRLRQRAQAQQQAQPSSVHTVEPALHAPPGPGTGEPGASQQQQQQPRPQLQQQQQLDGVLPMELVDLSQEPSSLPLQQQEGGGGAAAGETGLQEQGGQEKGPGEGGEGQQPAAAVVSEPRPDGNAASATGDGQSGVRWGMAPCCPVNLGARKAGIVVCGVHGGMLAGICLGLYCAFFTLLVVRVIQDEGS
jgi:hypothetical protein